MSWNTHRYGRWQMHAKYAGGRPDPNAKVLGNRSGDPDKTVKSTIEREHDVRADTKSAISDKRRKLSLEYLDRMAARDEWTTVNRQRDHERITRHARRAFNEEHVAAMRKLKEDYGALEQELEAAVIAKGLDVSGIREFNEWIVKNPFEKISRLYTRMNQIAAKEDELRLTMTKNIIQQLTAFDSISARYTQLSKSQADLMTFIGIAALYV